MISMLQQHKFLDNSFEDFQFDKKLNSWLKIDIYFKTKKINQQNLVWGIVIWLTAFQNQFLFVLKWIELESIDIESQYHNQSLNTLI